MLQQSDNVRSLIFIDPFGVKKSPEDAFSLMKPGSMTISPFTGRQPGDNLPRAPFLVPAVIEALRSHREWTPLIQVVPGEADTFCAQDVRRNGGIVLTSDSDLLIQDLGVDGRVSFFWEVVRQDPPAAQALSASTYSFHGINDQLGVKDVGGLPRVVFEQVSGQLGFDVAVRRAKENAADTLTSPDYLEFLKKHQVDDSIPADDLTLAAISALDPRISEIVVQTLIMSGPGLAPVAPSNQAGTSRGPEALSMFLPVMTENRDLKSCWTASADTRQITYSVLQTLSSHRTQSIIEYRTLDRFSPHTGRRLDIPREVDAIDACGSLVATLNGLKERIPTAGTLWLAFAVLQDINACAEDAGSSLSATLLSEADSPSTYYSWDLLHYTAQIQASYYSLRMARQVLDVVSALGRDLPAPFRTLRESLAPLPPIADWPTVEDMPGLLSAFAAEGALDAVTDVLGVPRVDLARVAAVPTSLRGKSKPQRGSRRSPHRGRGPRCPSLNPFALLSEAGQD